MRFARTQDLAAFLMALAGLSAAALGTGSSTAGFLAIVAALGAIFVPKKWMESHIWQMVWSASTIAGLAVALLGIGASGSFLIPIHGFVLYLVVVKLYNRRHADDYFHIYLTSLMALVGSAATNFGPSFVVCFLVHLVASFWSLSLYQLRKEMESAHLVRHKTPGSSRPLALARVLASKRVITGRFLVGSGLAALGAFGFAVFFFFFFPRFGVAGFNPETQNQGFAREVDLGGIGLIRNDPRLVMRVRLDPRPAAPILTSLHWRAATLDHYEAGHWSRTKVPVTGPSVNGRSLWMCNPDRRRLKALEKSGKILTQRILALPDTDGLLPTAFPFLSLRILRPAGSWKVGPTMDGSEAIQTPWPDRPVLYEVRSLLGSSGPSPAATTSGLPCTRPPRLDARLRRLYSTIPHRIGRALLDLAGRLEPPNAAPMAKIRAALAYLSPRNGFRYTRRLSRVPPNRDPVLHFLLVSKKGHCEYFASGLVLLLRAMGLPARLAVGFLGGRWNPYGGFLSVRRGDAHAWTEVWIEDRGWMLLDATPPEGLRPVVQPGLWARLSLWLDAVRLAYLRWIVDYDTMTQFHVLRRLGRSRALGLVVRITLGAVLGLVLLLAGRRLWTLRRVPSSGKGPKSDRRVKTASKHMARLLKAAAGRIGPIHPGQTLKEYFSTIPDDWAQARKDALEATEAYYELRFADSPSDEQSLIDRLKATCRRAVEGLSVRAKPGRRND